MRPTGQQAANAAIVAVTRVPPILYATEDCQGFVEATVRRAGGEIKDYAGSNDMYRNACTNIIPLNKAIAEKKLEPGMVLFIVAQDGGEPAKYKADGKGNASHIGFYTGGIYEVVHSSATKGQVAASTLKNGWTHAGWLKDVNYGEQSEAPVMPDIITSLAYIDLPLDETVFLRIKPQASSPWFARVRGKEQVELVGIKDGWARVRYDGHDGYIKEEFVVRDGSAVDTLPPTSNDTPLDNTYLVPYIEALETAFTALKRAMGV